MLEKRNKERQMRDVKSVFVCGRGLRNAFDGQMSCENEKDELEREIV